jgi:hypothetical protein
LLSSRRCTRKARWTGAGAVTESEALKSELDALKYPLFFMDFESVNPCVPRFGGMHPYDHLCFQYSVHVVRELGAPSQHIEFLATDASEPLTYVTGRC